MFTNLCYVGECGEPTVIGCRHKRFGLVASCAAHNPIKHAYDAPLLDVNAAGEPVVILPEYREINARIAGTWKEPAPEAPRDGGMKVRAGKRGPKLPPNDGAALAVPVGAGDDINF